MKIKHFFILTFLLLLSSFFASAQTPLVKNGKAKGRIICSPQNTVNDEAASLLRQFVERISGASLPIVHLANPRKGDIVIGESTTRAGEDGFALESDGGVLRIKSGGDRGSIYGVVELLERYLGVTYYAKDVYTLTLQPNVSEIELFTVTTNAAARQGSAYFHLMTPMEGCAIGSPSSERIIMTGYVTVQRGSISQYCSKTENQTICLEKPFNEIRRQRKGYRLGT